MTNPVPGYPVSSGYHKSGSHWTTCGWHTGQDYAAPAGTPVVAARAGTVAYVDYGPAFGGHQFAIRPGDGTEDFYAHCRTRPLSGSHVGIGEPVAQVGAEGNTTGPHLHFERHLRYGWGCSIMADPMLSHNAGAAPDEEDDMPSAEDVARAVWAQPMSASDGQTYPAQAFLEQSNMQAEDTVNYPLPHYDGAHLWTVLTSTLDLCKDMSARLDELAASEGRRGHPRDVLLVVLLLLVVWLLILAY